MCAQRHVKTDTYVLPQFPFALTSKTSLPDNIDLMFPDTENLEAEIESLEADIEGLEEGIFYCSFLIYKLIMDFSISCRCTHALLLMHMLSARITCMHINGGVTKALNYCYRYCYV